ncbi:XdhC family protein [Shumkonia mesophila]|uniref:XdhC family protein n=1 Tax=Shumkonia mesophila TaxID=2838854 RepID=UPI002934FA35|nr:XdhC family protein [Shumkonia mesophila]
MDDDAVLDTAQAWLTEGAGVALATVIETWGSAPRPIGSHLAVAANGAFAGSVSGGCVEGAVVTGALEVLAKGLPRTLEFGVSDQKAWDVGLACGGTIRVHVEPLGMKRDCFDALQDFRRRQCPVAAVSDLGNGLQALVTAEEIGGDLPLSPETAAAVRLMLAEDRSGLAEGLFVRSYGPPWALYVVGAVHIAQALAPMAELAGFSVAVIDPRSAFATESRFPHTRVVTTWPDEALAAMPPGPHTAVVALTHDPKIDDPALAAALRSPAFYIGALGSRRNHERRVERLAEAGFAPDQLARIAGPVGLDLGGRSAGEIAVSIVAEIVATRHGRRRDRP